MYINRAEIDAAVSAYRTLRKRKTQAASSVSSDTETNLYVGSGEGASLAELTAMVASEPLYREALVRELHRRVSEGRYFVPAEKIVEKLLGRLVLEAMHA